MKCMTDGNGPEKFKICAHSWIDRSTSKESFQFIRKGSCSYYLEWMDNMYGILNDNGKCNMRRPPSYRNILCRKFYQKIGQLK